jgi:hypothetical protein
MGISIKDDIIDAFVYNVKQMTVARGYNYTYSEVSDLPRDVNSLKYSPSVNIFEGNEVCENTSGNSHEQTGGNQCKMFCSMDVEFDVWIKEINTARKARNKVLSDFQKYFGLNWIVPDENGVASVFNCMYLSSTPWGEEVNKPITGITIRFRVWYDYKFTDPTLRG